MRSNFEQYLIADGFIPDSDKTFYSSIDHIQTIYTKGDRQVYYGLCERGWPPSIIYPRPNVNCPSGYVDDRVMARIMSKYTPEQILNACFDKSINLEL